MWFIIFCVAHHTGDQISGSSVSFKADSSQLGSVADETILESEQAMKAAYHIHRPKLPPVPSDLPAGTSESDVQKALDSDAGALMASGTHSLSSCPCNVQSSMC